MKLEPNDRVYINWKMLEECYEFIKGSYNETNKDIDNRFRTFTSTPTTSLMNKISNKDEIMKSMFASFKLTLYNNPRQVGIDMMPRIKSDYSSVITNNTTPSSYLWVVPFIKSDNIKDIELYFIRVSSLSIVNGKQGEFSGVIGPFGINSEAAKFPKTLFAPIPTKTENIDGGEPTHPDETEIFNKSTPSKIHMAQLLEDEIGSMGEM
ncbi:8416_t:CDS:2, partial [Scutellospora calospora]